MDPDAVSALAQLSSRAIPAGSQDCHPAPPLMADTHLFLGHLTQTTHTLVPGRIRHCLASYSETAMNQASWPPCPNPELDQQRPRLLGVEVGKDVAKLKQLLGGRLGART